MSDTQSYKTVTFSELAINNIVLALHARLEFLHTQLAIHADIGSNQTERLQASKQAVLDALVSLAEVA